MEETRVVPRTEKTKEGDAKYFEGKLVEIYGMGEKIVPDESMRERFPDMTPIDLNGQRGRAVNWLKEQKKYVVETFNGFIACVPGENLKDFEPLEPTEDGGFDVAWTAHGSVKSREFGSTVAGHVERKGYCVMQMFLGDAGCARAADEIGASPNFVWLNQDIADEYLGRDAVNSKIAWLRYGISPDDDTVGECVSMFDLALFEPISGRMEGMSPLETCDQMLTNLCFLMYPYTPAYEDDDLQFVSWGRTSSMIRCSFENMEDEDRLRSASSDSPELDEVLEKHNDFVDQRRVCMMLVLDSEAGGELKLHPLDGDEVTIPLTPNQLVVFRHDAGGYTFEQTGRHTVLQAWLLDEPAWIKDTIESLRLIDGPEEPDGERVNIMSMMTRYPGSGFEPLAYLTMFMYGTDTQLHVPKDRWDTDIYYRREHTIGYSMTCHGSMVTSAEIQQFDNNFFGIPSKVAEQMAPKDRLTLEVGYETMYRGNYRREDLKGLNCGVFVGDSGSDWSDTRVTPHMWSTRLNAITCTRFSHIFGMVGPCSTAETACSSSLVATGVAKMAMRVQQPDQARPSISSNLLHSLVVGVNTLIGPQSYIGLSGPGMLTTQGRCFTFDHSADGFARGEGIGGLKLLRCSDPYEAVGRYAMLIGAAVNQDGRSASMTAPHGPSQQEVIRASMREAGLSAGMMTLAECHGTGTSLGDPIEVGALRGVMREDREEAFCLTSAKTNLGHLEAGAGVAGLIKCVLMLFTSTALNNLHLLTLNPHLDVDAFPAYFETENTDFGKNSGLNGVSSFGFGGTNARADVWGHAQMGWRRCITGPIATSRDL